MQRQGPLTIRHIVVASVVLAVVGALLAWWLIYGLRENRARLRLERERLLGACAHQATQVSTRLLEAEQALSGALVTGLVPGEDDAPPPFAAWSEQQGVAPCEPGWERRDELAVLRMAIALRCVEARLDTDWMERLLQIGDELEVRRELPDPSDVWTSSGIVAELPTPFAGWMVQPRHEVWKEITDEYRGRMLMMISEGCFFLVLLSVLFALLWKTMGREFELERQHRNFLSAITHELKSPLAAMRLSLETVLRGRADGTASLRFLENALQDAERLESLLQKVLEVTRFGRGDDAVKTSRANLSEAVEDTIRSFSRRTTTVGARISTELQPEIWVGLDEEAFQIVLSNLLENAIKYGGTIPEIAVSLRVEHGRAVLDVRDNGKGIAEEDLPFVFNRFYRGGDEMTRTTQGTGLGLFLVQQIVGAHRGTVGVASTGPGGTTFRVTLDGAEVWEERP